MPENIDEDILNSENVCARERNNDSSWWRNIHSSTMTSKINYINLVKKG